MERILVDMDAVLGDVYARFIDLEIKESGIKLELDSLVGKLEQDAFPHFDKHVHTKGFFRHVPLIDGSVEGLRYLNDKYEVLIVSSSTEFPNSLTDKMEWMEENFPFISWKQIVLCGRKDIIKGDAMIDDHLKNLTVFDGKRFLFTAPHNQLIVDKSCQRINHWEEIKIYL